jgi:putative transposase
MPDYRRDRVPGGTFFFTVNLLDRRSDLLVTQIDILRDAVRRVRARAPFHIDTRVLLADHMHGQWTLACGPCRQAMPASLVGGAPSKPHL